MLIPTLLDCKPQIGTDIVALSILSKLSVWQALSSFRQRAKTMCFALCLRVGRTLIVDCRTLIGGHYGSWFKKN